MTSTMPVAARRPLTPGPVKLARLLVVVQTVIGLLTTVTLGFLALLGLAWTTDDGTGPDALAIAYTAIFAVSLGVTIAVPCLTGGLRPGAAAVRVALIVVESVAVGVTLTLLATAKGEGALDGLFVAPTVYAACGLGTIVALLSPAVRGWSTAAPRA